MRTTHKLTTPQALIISGALVLVAGLLFALMPMRQVAAKQPASAQPKQTTLSPTTSRMNFAAYTKMQAALKNQTAAAASPFDFRTASPITRGDFMANATWATALFNADETIVLSSTPPNGAVVSPGQLVLYTTTVTNPTRPGTVLAVQDFNASVVLNVPTGMIYQGLTLGGTGGFLLAGCTQPAIGAAGGLAVNVTCTNVAGMAAGSTMTFGVLTQVSALPPGTVINTPADSTYTDSDDTNPGVGVTISTATISSNQPASFNVIGGSDPADLIVNKTQANNGTLAPGQVIAGGTQLASPAVGTGEILYTITVSNAGAAGAINVQIQDNVPPNVTYVAGSLALTGGITCTGTPIPGQQFVCIPNDAVVAGRFDASTTPKTISYKVFVPASVAQGTIIQNAALIASMNGVGGSTPDPNAANNLSLTVPTQVLAFADLGITKMTSAASPVAGGATFTYTLGVTNAGPSDAQNVVVSDPLPADVLFQSVTITGPNAAAFTCTAPAINANGTITCTAGTLPVGGSATIAIAVSAAASATGARTNTATIASATTEATPNTALNTASIPITIVNNANLTIGKFAPATACAGDTITYLWVVRNTGNSTALDTRLLDNLPANTTFVSLKETGDLVGKCAYSQVGHQVGCGGFGPSTPANLAPGAHNLDITVRINPNAPVGALANTARIIGFAGPNPLPAFPILSNTVNTTVSHCSDLEVTKDDSPDAVLAGQDINYTITLKNNGPSDLAGNEVQVTDVLPLNPGTAAPRATAPNTIIAPGFSCNGLSPVAASFPCIYTGVLQAGASVQIKFPLTVNPAFGAGQPGSVVTNSATGAIIAANVTDSNLNNNTSTINTPVGPSADLSVTKTSRTLGGALLGATVNAGGDVVAGFGTGNIGTGEIEYTLTYRNDGLGDARNVHIRDVIPAGTLLVPSPAVTTGVVVTPVTGPPFVCSILQNLATYALDCAPAGGPNTLVPAGSNGT
ncbi:MAG: DUF11 domain-containing protein, partial [Acidobacteria bacterium]|nr:DUF11 domain-containing protein [Acidobacteriota bacterium]